MNSTGNNNDIKEGTTSNNNEITEEGAMPSSSTTSGSNINYEGTTSNDNNIKEGMSSSSNNNDIKEGMNSTRNNNYIKEGMKSTSNNNDMNEDHVTVFVAYDGKWEHDGKEWFYKNSKSSIMVVPKHITLSKITEILHKELKVHKFLCRLKLEVHYRTGSPWFPVTKIQNDQDLSVFISETSKTKLPLCVTRLDDEFTDTRPYWTSRYAQPILLNKINSDDDEISSDDDEEIPDGTLVNRLRKAQGIVNPKEVAWKIDDEGNRTFHFALGGNKDNEVVRWTSKLDDEGNTLFHFAVGDYKDNKVVRDILMEIDGELIAFTVNNYGANPAHTAALFGNTEALKIMLKSNRRCLIIRDNDNLLPINYALAIPAINTFLYLFKQMKSSKVEYDILFGGMHGLHLLHQVIDTGLIDVAYELINDYPSLATTVYRDKTALECIISKLELFYSETSYGFYSRFVYQIVPIENNSLGSIDTADLENQETSKKDKFVTKHTRRCLHDVISRIRVKLWETTLLLVPHVKHLRDDKVKHNTTIELLRRICEEAVRTLTSSDIKRYFSSPLCLAVENNNADAIDMLTTYFPGLYNSEKDGYNIYQMIVLNRSEKVYRYILHHQRFAKFRFSASKDDDDNNILHLVGRLGPRHKLIASSGAALQMQRELQWFEEVMELVGIEHTRKLNKNKETPMMVFRREHMELRKDGEEWIKRTADSYTVTAALIIAIVFAAAITVPGGNDSDTGKPIYETKASLIIFAISDAISLFSATASLLYFLSVITARYAEEDFLYRLPSRLFMHGLLMLFVSLTSMMIAFSAALYTMFGQGKTWILIPIAALACLPIASLMEQFPLLLEIISSTYGGGYFFKEKDYRQSSANANKKKRA